MASAACIKIDGVPVEFRVATIFEAMMALFPIPEIITLPLECLNMQSTALEKSSFKREPKCELLPLQFQWFSSLWSSICCWYRSR